MSKFMDFYSHVAESEETTKKLTDFMSKFDADSDRDAIFEELIVFAKEEGYNFEKAEVKSFFEGMTAAGELSDDELSAVAGGKGGCFVLGMDEYGNPTCMLVGVGYGEGGCAVIGVVD